MRQARTNRAAVKQLCDRHVPTGQRPHGNQADPYQPCDCRTAIRRPRTNRAAVTQQLCDRHVPTVQQRENRYSVSIRFHNLYTSKTQILQIRNTIYTQSIDKICPSSSQVHRHWSCTTPDRREHKALMSSQAADASRKGQTNEQRGHKIQTRT